MKKGKAVRIYYVNEKRLKEALSVLDELVKPLKEVLKNQQK